AVRRPIAGAGRRHEGGDGGVRGDDGGGARERRPGHADPGEMSAPHRDHTLILASGSPRRRELLAMLGLPFRVVVPAVDETRKTSEVPDRYVVRIARDKAGAYAVQGRGAVLVEGIRGDFFGVMGLPLRLALELLERFGMPYRFTR